MGWVWDVEWVGGVGWVWGVRCGMDVVWGVGWMRAVRWVWDAVRPYPVWSKRKLLLEVFN